MLTPGIERLAHGTTHHQRVTGMEAAGDVSRADDLQQFGVLPIFPAPGFRRDRRWG